MASAGMVDKTYSAQKRIKDLFVAQSTKPPHLAPVDLRTLTPFQRGLLVIDSTLTQFIEAYTLSPVEVVVLGQKTHALSADHVWLDAPKDTAVVTRQVLLQSHSLSKQGAAKMGVVDMKSLIEDCVSGGEGEAPTFYAYAVSLIVLDRLPEIIKQGLEVEGEGLGKLLACIVSSLQSRPTSCGK
jgi:hypothetical protein